MRKNWYIEYTINNIFYNWYCDKRIIDNLKQFSNTTQTYKILLIKKYNPKTNLFEIQYQAAK